MRVDVEAARRLPGVHALITAAEAAAMPATGMSIAARHLFARDEVRTVADVIAAVAAVDDETACRAVVQRKADQVMEEFIAAMRRALEPGA